MRANEEWQDSNSFIYTDPRFEGMLIYCLQEFDLQKYEYLVESRW